MKMIFIPVYISISWFCSAFLFQQDKNHYKENATPESAIDGAWQLYSTTTGQHTTFHNKPSQIKVFSKGYHAMIAYDDMGKFSFATAGPYTLNANHYQETFSHHTYEPWQGVSMSWDWSLSNNGDTLYFSGPSKIIQADGVDITDTWENQIFEKRIRLSL